MDHVIRDLRMATRALRRSPAFTLVAVLTVALGIGATTTIFSLLDAVLLKPLPYPEPTRLVVPRSTLTGTNQSWNVCYADFLDWRKNDVFEHVAVTQDLDVDLTGRGDPVRIRATAVTDQFFAALGTRPLLGRVFRSDEFRPGPSPGVVLSYGMWQSRFGGDPAIVGSIIQVNGTSLPVLGVMPSDFQFPRETQLWGTIRVDVPPTDWLEKDNYVFESVARLKQGRSLAATRAQLAALARRVELADPSERAKVSVTSVPLSDFMLGPVLPRTLWVLMGAVGFVLLIGCVNVANLLLARSTARARELALRSALGAGRARLIAHMLVESGLIAFAGGVLGVLISIWGVDALRTLAPQDVPRLASVHVSPIVLAFSLAISALSALAFGLAPALRASHVSLTEALAEGGARTGSGIHARRARSVLVVAEVALSLMLLTGAALMMRSVFQLQRADTGIHETKVVTFGIGLPHRRYPENAQQLAFFKQLTERLSALPGVRSASMCSALPLGGGGFYLGRAFIPEGGAPPPEGREINGMWTVVGPEFFSTMGIPVVAGREFNARDDSSSTMVAVVNRRFAREMFGSRDPLGKRFQSWRDEKKQREIVGVVDDVRYFGVSDTSRPLVYVPHTQNTWSAMVLVVRTEGDPSGLMSAVRREIAGMDKDLALADVATLRQITDASLARPRFQSMLLGLFAMIALVLAAVGIYGVLSYTVSQRTHEIGVRMALGAREVDVLRAVLGGALGLVVVGILTGWVGALALTRLLRSLLYEVSPTDAPTFLGVAGLLGLIAIGASLVPAWRAARVDPVVALREE